ncbi:MAG: hypothetical protein A2452_11040 [Candidatus Firestonebacteria bacterium RIFOXYC2_FULL_39_67]|nr:MAG: hypothetical protein A2452_11040 [Candidatus Firestonebacteria bacterium RIFOXYC2_FULL_39_67]
MEDSRFKIEISGVGKIYPSENGGYLVDLNGKVTIMDRNALKKKIVENMKKEEIIKAALLNDVANLFREIYNEM